jgi:hypothetical protein
METWITLNYRMESSVMWDFHTAKNYAPLVKISALKLYILPKEYVLLLPPGPVFTETTRLHPYQQFPFVDASRALPTRKCNDLLVPEQKLYIAGKSSSGRVGGQLVPAVVFHAGLLIFPDLEVLADSSIS